MMLYIGVLFPDVSCSASCVNVYVKGRYSRVSAGFAFEATDRPVGVDWTALFGNHAAQSADEVDCSQQVLSGWSGATPAQVYSYTWAITMCRGLVDQSRYQALADLLGKDRDCRARCSVALTRPDMQHIARCSTTILQDINYYELHWSSCIINTWTDWLIEVASQRDGLRPTSKHIQHVAIHLQVVCGLLLSHYAKLDCLSQCCPSTCDYQ